MKIGVLTFHSAHNYGAVIQTYCVQQILRNLGHEVYIVDYRPNYIESAYKRRNKLFRADFPLGMTSLRHCVYNTFNYIKERNRYRKFQKFTRKYYRFIPFRYEELKKIDIFVFGGDQIWNPEITNGSIDSVFLGDFKAAEGKKLISFSASPGAYNFCKSELQVLERQLRKFSLIGVRESVFSNLLRDKLKLKDVYWWLDPSLVLTPKYYTDLIPKKNMGKSKVLLFRSESNMLAEKVANRLANKINTSVIEICYGYRKIGIRRKNILVDCSPEDLLSYIKNATSIITTSFHGVALSIALKKDFLLVETDRNVDKRSINLMEKLDIKNRYVSSDSFNFDMVGSIDYAIVEHYIAKERNNILKKLENVLR